MCSHKSSVFLAESQNVQSSGYQGRRPAMTQSNGCLLYTSFAEGWNDNGYYLGRPVDVAQLADGSLLVSDDLVGALYRIWYDGK